MIKIGTVLVIVGGLLMTKKGDGDEKKIGGKLFIAGFVVVFLGAIFDVE